MKLESQVNEVFFYQNMHFLHAKIIRRRRHRHCRKIDGKTANICPLAFLRKNSNFLGISFFNT
jgi:hypothetical protein